MNEPFGRQLLVDLYQCQPSTINNLRLCYDFLDRAVVALKVTKQSQPHVFQSPEEGHEDKAGLSGWVPLIESHVAIHTLTAKNFVSIDFYTCGLLDEDMKIDLIILARDVFKPAKVETQMIERGKMYYD